MSHVTTISRASLVWLLVAQALVMVPFWFHVPLWMVAFWLGCSFWRIQVYRMRAAFPGRLLELLLLLFTIAGIWLSRSSLIGLDAGAVLLVAMFILKLVETRTHRDALVLIFLGLFCVAVAYLFEDSLPWAAYSLLPIGALLAALIGLQQGPGTRPAATLKLAATLLAQAVPLMLLLFLFFPRIAPLWSLPLPSDKGLSGLSENMSPADVAELGRSADLAFRASFDGPLPPRRALYWRALTLEQFDGRRWSQSPGIASSPAPKWQASGEPWRYSILLQPSGKPWLPTLDVASSDLGDVRQLADYRLQRQRPVQQALLYRASSLPQVSRDPQLDERARRRALQLPAQGDPRTRQWATELRRTYPQPDALVAALLGHFHDEPYHYTLRPPTLGPDSIDGFLFDSRQGFCAHFAGAMTYVLRAAGIPARVVAGYQGGELNPAGHFLTVRQYDAHAWVEYWQAGQGWRSVDPTYAVAPQRIDQGLEQALVDEGAPGALAFSPLRYRQLSWLNELRLGWDNLNYAWQRWVLGYQGEQQLQILGRWFGDLAGVMLPIGLVLILALLSLWLLRPWQAKADPQLRAFMTFERLLRRRGLVREPGEGPLAFVERAAAQLPLQAPDIRRFGELFVSQRYAEETPSMDVLQQALQALRRSL
ncbi:transglutaminase TgpA family protein [Pseudomonas sp. RHF3.3-3]|uniref:transglutaminase TgpA family protein n=1 Tax=Pseudomonas sp. RHF3.3-3 TaxID=3396624 RepID=UPI003A886687